MYQININQNHKKQCNICKGFGQVKSKVQVCKICNGNKCIQCGIKESGFDNIGYQECTQCYGSGSISK